MNLTRTVRAIVAGGKRLDAELPEGIQLAQAYLHQLRIVVRFCQIRGSPIEKKFALTERQPLSQESQQDYSIDSMITV